jgi:ABC-type lipoprotein export system ATPase subunit
MRLGPLYLVGGTDIVQILDDASARSYRNPPPRIAFVGPTNHLDLESINALNVALQKYEGSLLLVTHDQDLLEEVGT